jgi:1-acyl-sn-glycerol-3-phosphate acyltransferase
MPGENEGFGKTVMVRKLVKWITRLLAFLTARVEISGLDKIPESGGCIVASNHIGRLEVLLVYAFLPRSDIILIAAEKYRKYGVFRWLVDRMDAVWVERFNADLHAVREVLKRLKQGEVFVIAPEGTRSKTEALQPARPGAAYLASKSGVPIFPVGVVGTEDRIVRENLKRLRRSRVRTVIGDPFVLPEPPKGNRDAVMEQNTDEIMCRIAALLPESHRGVYKDHPRLKELLQASSEKESFVPVRE